MIFLFWFFLRFVEKKRPPIWSMFLFGNSCSSIFPGPKTFPWSFFVLQHVKHLLFHRKQHNLSIFHKHSLLNLDVNIKSQIFFLLHRHIRNLTSLSKKKYRSKKKPPYSLPATTATTITTTPSANAILTPAFPFSPQ